MKKLNNRWYGGREFELLFLFTVAAGGLFVGGVSCSIISYATFVDLSDRSVESQKIFAGRLMNPILGRALPLSPSGLPEIREREKELLRIIRAKSPEVKVEFVLSYFGGGAAAGCRTADGVACIRLSVPYHMDACLTLSIRDTENWRDEFETCLIIEWMHELEHLALDAPISDIFPSGRSLPNEELAWARTCKFTLLPLHEKYGKKISFFDGYMRAWNECGRPVGYHEKWHRYVTSVYDGRKQRKH